MKYYSLKPILKRKAVYNVIIGERSNGKTFACLKLALENYFTKGEQFAYIRRWSTDVKPSRLNQLFSSVIDSGILEKLSQGNYATIIFKSGCFYLANYNNEGKPIYSDTDILGYAMSLNESEHLKSISFPRVTMIVFDEFLSNNYLMNEFVLFMNVVSTIVRQRTNVSIFMLGNTVSKYSPYFKELGLTNVLKMKQGTIDVYTYGNSKLTVAVEYCASMEKSKKNNFYFAFDNPRLKMITGGSWELGIFPHKPVEFTKDDVKFIYFIEFNETIYQCEIVFLPDQKTFTYIHKKTTPLKQKSKVYSLVPNPSYYYSTSISRPQDELERKIYWYFANDKVFYQDNEVGNAIENFLKLS